MERDNCIESLTDNEINFFSQRDGFYIACVGENNFPYIQHRGGPKGFVKAIDEKRIGFIDFRGNMKYISVCNITSNNNVSLIMADYSTGSRLNILAKAKTVELDDYELYNLLDLEGYKFRPERFVVLNIESYDWEYPQSITEGYNAENKKKKLNAQKNNISKFEA
jgi:uncharacterized protein